MQKFTLRFVTISLIATLGIFLYMGLNVSTAVANQNREAVEPVLITLWEPIRDADRATSDFLFAPANLSQESVRQATVTTFVPAGTSLEAVSTGWLTQYDENGPLPQAEAPYKLTILYLTEDKSEWREWRSWDPPIPFSSERLSPTSLPQSDADQVTAVQFVYSNLSGRFRWGDPFGMPRLTLSSKLPAGTRIETCSSAVFFDNLEQEIRKSSCTNLEFAPTTRDLTIGWDQPNRLDSNSETELNFELNLSSALDVSEDFDAFLELPAWIDLRPLPVSAGITSTASYTLSSRLNDDQHTRLVHVSFLTQTISNTATFSVSIPVTVAPEAPTGFFDVTILVNSDHPNQTCWGEPAHSQDENDLDRDGDLAELVCQLTQSLETWNTNRLVVTREFERSTHTGGISNLFLHLTNTGSEPIEAIDLVEQLPRFGSQQSQLLLIEPIEIPDGLTLYGSSADDLCDPRELACLDLSWTYQEPNPIDQTTALYLTGLLEDQLLPGERLTLEMTVQTGQDWPANTPLRWEGLPFGSNQAETVIIPTVIELSPPPPLTTGLIGAAWEDIVADQTRSLDEPVFDRALIELWGIGLDNEPYTDDDLLLELGRSDQRINGRSGNFQLTQVISGTAYYLRARPTTGYRPVPQKNDQSFRPEDGATPLFIFKETGAISPTHQLGLNWTPTASVVGLITIDQNENGVLDEPFSAGANDVLVELIDQTGKTVQATATTTNHILRPGTFSFNAIEPGTTYQIRWSSSSPFIVDAAQNITVEDAADGQHIALSPAFSPAAGERLEFKLLLTAPPTGADSGDAPEVYGDALHGVDEGSTIGLIADINPIPVNLDKLAGLGDDQQSFSDEDGIIFMDNGKGTIADDESELVVVVRNQERFEQALNGWIDYNGDGFFAEDEQIIKEYRLNVRENPQAHRFIYDIPEEASCGQTYARFRLGPTDGRPTGKAASGEVEDFPYTIQCVADLVVSVTNNANPVGENEILNWYMSVKNDGPSVASDVELVATIPNDLFYQGHVSLTNDPVECNDPESIAFTQTIRCTMPQLDSGQAITVNLATVVPFNYEGKRIVTTITASTTTPEQSTADNYVRQGVAVDKQWVLGPLNLFTFTHADFYDGLIDNPDQTEQDFKHEEEIISHINVPISIAIGVHADAKPFITIPACLDDPDQVVCNNTNYIQGQLVQESYSVEEISLNEEPIYRPEEPLLVRLNRIANSNLSSCGVDGSCVGYQLFRVGKSGVSPYQWTDPVDYLYLNFVTSGGREVECPDNIDENQCVIIDGAKPGTYTVDGSVEMVYKFDDPRLGGDPIDIYRTRTFRTTIVIIAPFIEADR